LPISAQVHIPKRAFLDSDRRSEYLRSQGLDQNSEFVRGKVFGQLLPNKSGWMVLLEGEHEPEHPSRVLYALVDRTAQMLWYSTPTPSSQHEAPTASSPLKAKIAQLPR
jgi:hypothetical protein